MKNTFIFSLFLLAACSQSSDIPKDIYSPEVVQKVTFKSLDGLDVHGNLYHKDYTAPMLVLCHMARFSKLEYIEIAKNLHKRGFNSLAIDLRSGGHTMEFFNETFAEAEKNGLPTQFLDAEKDIVAAVGYAAEKYEKVILWGSSYSSGLAMKVAKELTEVDAVLSFSPGEYYGKDFSLADSINGLNKPCFITSSKEEANESLDTLVSKVQSSILVQYIPETVGSHGSSALWATKSDNKGYWDAVYSFLDKLK